MILIITLFLQFFSYFFSEDLLLWKNTSDLKYEDFKAQQSDTLKAGNHKYLGAMSAINIEYATQKLGKYGIPKVSIKNYFDRDHSWMLVKDPYVLQHEQIHFNISELYARKIRKSADSLARKNITNLSVYRNMVSFWEQKKQKTNDQFDAENDDSFLKIGKEIFFKKNPKQKEWLDKINLELQKLNIYTYENNL